MTTRAPCIAVATLCCLLVLARIACQARLDPIERPALAFGVQGNF